MLIQDTFDKIARRITGSAQNASQRRCERIRSLSLLKLTDLLALARRCACTKHLLLALPIGLDRRSDYAPLLVRPGFPTSIC